VDGAGGEELSVNHGTDYEEYKRQISGFPARAKKLIKETGMTQRALARKIGMHEVELSRYLTGKQRGGMSLYLAWKLARGLGVGIDRLFFGRTATQIRTKLPSVREYPSIKKGEQNEDSQTAESRSYV
jgi:transcriptional regulator with XRE-family HTH domain